MTLKRSPLTPDFFMTLALTGELDTDSIPALCELTSKVLTEGSRHLIMDLTGVTRCDDASLFTVLGIRQAVHHAGGSLILANPSPSVQNTLARSALRDQLPYHDILAPGPPRRSAPPDGFPGRPK
ncbi:STAS domain-containing protein [Streptomyces sp. NPDC055239]